MSNPNKMTNWYFGLSSLQLLITAGIALSRGSLQSSSSENQYSSAWNLAATSCHVALLGLSCVTMLLRTKPVCDRNTNTQSASTTITDTSDIEDIFPIEDDAQPREPDAQCSTEIPNVVTGALKNALMISQSMLGFGLVCVSVLSMGRLPATQERLYSGLQFSAVALFALEQMLRSLPESKDAKDSCKDYGTSLATSGLASLAVMAGALGSDSAARQAANTTGDIANYHTAGLLSTGSAILLTMSFVFALVHACNNRLITTADNTTSTDYTAMGDENDLETGSSRAASR